MEHFGELVTCGHIIIGDDQAASRQGDMAVLVIQDKAKQKSADEVIQAQEPPG